MLAHEDKIKIIEKLKKLLNLIEENYSQNSDEFLIAPDLLEVLEIISKLEMGQFPEKKDLMKMNVIWTRNRNIQKLGTIEGYKKFIWEKIDNFIKEGKSLEAIKVVRQNMTSDKGEILSFSEAEEVVENRRKELLK